MKPIVLLLLFWHAAGAVTLYKETVSLPTTVKEMFQACKNIGKSQGIPEEDLWQAELACLVSYYNNLPSNEMTEKDWKPFKEATESRFGFYPPRTGFRTRRDLRTLTAEEWNRTVNVFVQMYKDGTLRAFANLHAKIIRTGHHGAAFLVWHRVFLTHFEEEMRKIDPNISLPYWDYSADFYIPKSTDSVVWSDCFLGSDSGAITGHFSGFYGAHYSFVTRNANSDCTGKLINLEDIDNLLQFCYYTNITTGKSTEDEYLKMKHNLELLHDEVHDWVGGDMGIVSRSAFDPVFYMHHAYIDSIFEEFRQHQATSCKNVDIESDYRNIDDLCLMCSPSNETLGHGPYEKMQGYPNIRNIDGLWLNWTTAFYKYEPKPSCPDNCKGEYLYCDTTYDQKKYPHGICVSKTKDACKENIPRKSRSTENEGSLMPTASCKTSRKTFDVINGDGRIRRMSVQDSLDQLQQFLGLKDSGNESSVKDSDQTTDAAGIAFGVLFGIETIAIIILTYVLLRKRYTLVNRSNSSADNIPII